MSKLNTDEAVLGLAASVATRACELIRDGWTKGKMHTLAGGAPDSFCIHGALDLALEEVFGDKRFVSKLGVRQDVEDVAVAFICDEAFGRMHSRSGGIPAASYNDASERKHGEVVGVMSRAADRLWDIVMDQASSGEEWRPTAWAEADTNSEEAKQFLYAPLN